MRYRNAHTPTNPTTPHAILNQSRMRRAMYIPFPVVFSRKSWNGSFVRAIAPRRHLRVLPTRTRPSLFGSD